MQREGPHTGKLKVQEGRQELEEGEAVGESGEMQAELVGLQECVSPGVWEEEWGTQWRRGGEQGQQTGGGIWKQEVGARQGHGRRSVPAQRGTACRGGNTRHQQTGRNKKAKPGHLEHPPRTRFPLRQRSEMETYPTGEKGGALCSGLSPKPKSDLKNKMLTPTILITLCCLNP